MGFPLIDPANGRLLAYHPDFFEYRTREIRNKDGSTDLRQVGRIIEIKGALTPESQLKIRLFKKYYIDNDFTGVPPERLKLAKALVAKNRELAQKQFRIRLGKQTPFRVFGELPFRMDEANFVRHVNNGEGGDTLVLGMVPRLARRFPDLFPKEFHVPLSVRQQREETKKATSGNIEFKTVQARRIQRKPRIPRSKEFLMDIHNSARLFGMAAITSHAFNRVLARRGMIQKDFFNPGYFDNILRAFYSFHLADARFQKQFRTDLSEFARNPNRRAYLLGICIYATYVENRFSNDHLITVKPDPQWDAMRDQIRENAKTIGDIADAALDILPKTDKELSTSLSREVFDEINQIAVAREPYETDLFDARFVIEQLAERMQNGQEFNFKEIRPTRNADQRKP